ncbi:MAG: hypothetical protein GY861_28065 [bacterium]|nr:hypothetical protein [bacterium]
MIPTDHGKEEDKEAQDGLGAVQVMNRRSFMSRVGIGIAGLTVAKQSQAEIKKFFKPSLAQQWKESAERCQPLGRWEYRYFFEDGFKLSSDHYMTHKEMLFYVSEHGLCPMVIAVDLEATCTVEVAK